MVNKITWQKAGRVAQPGRYMFTFGWLTVTAEDIGIWQHFPNATFTLVQLPGSDEDIAEEFHLGAFDIPQEEICRELLAQGSPSDA
ncbi:MAG: hypothetical protein ACM3OF_10525 [Gemmatimonas sp.]